MAEIENTKQKPNSNGPDGVSTVTTEDPNAHNEAPTQSLKKSKETQKDKLEEKIQIDTVPKTIDPNKVGWESTKETQKDKLEEKIEIDTVPKTIDPNIVDWESPTDPENPMNWSNTKKWCITIFVAILTLCISFSSSAYTGAIPGLLLQYDPSMEVLILGVTLFVIGFGTGPMLWAPLSEVFGRNTIYCVTFFIFLLFNLGCALAQNVETILVCRFFAGTFGASPLANAGGTLSDIWDYKKRGKAMTCFAIAPFMGPILGPVISGFISENLSWRIVFWVIFGFTGVLLLFLPFFPETYAPILLARKAERLRKETGNKKLRGPKEVKRKDLIPVYKRALSRPFRLLFGELIVFLVTLYMSFVYGLLYFFFEAYPVIFQVGHGFSAGISGLMFLGIGIGCLIAAILNLTYFEKEYEALSKQGMPKAEMRLPAACVGAVALPISLFWMAWTSFPSVIWVAPALAGIPFGFSMVHIFLSLMNYIVDCYVEHAASALAANAFLRSIAGACFPLFALQIFNALTPHWALTLLGGISILMGPVPLLFYKYGEKIRGKSKFATNSK